MLAALVLGADGLLARTAFSMPRRRRWAVALLLGAALVAGILTVRRNRDYRSALALYEATVRERPDSPYARAEYGLALGQDGQMNRRGDRRT